MDRNGGNVDILAWFGQTLDRTTPSPLESNPHKLKEVLWAKGKLAEAKTNTCQNHAQVHTKERQIDTIVKLKG